MNLFRKITGKLIALMLLLAAGAGCDRLHDDLSGCNFFLRFVYDYNMAGQDLFAAQVPEVRVFVFDAQGGYLQTLTEKGEALKRSGYRMHIPRSLKGCTIVVWAGRIESYYTVPVLQPGDPISKLTLEYDPQSGDESDAQLDPIWHSGPVEMTFPEEQERTQTVSLVRTTNDIRVKVETQSAAANPDSFEIALTGANNGCDYTHALLDPCRTLTYVPSSAATTSTEAWLYTMRLLEGNKMLLSVKEKSSGNFILIGGEKSIDLTEFLLKGTPDGMGRQEYLDKRYEWDITLDYDPVSYLAVSITINGWRHWFQSVDQ